MKFLWKMVLVVLGVLVALVLARNVVVKVVAEKCVRAVTGMPMSIGKLDLNFANSFVDIENLVVENPDGFHNTALVDIPKIFVGYNFSDILKGKVHLVNLEFSMKQFTVVKNEKGELNLDRLKALQGTQKDQAKTGKPTGQLAEKGMPIQIDKMRLRIGKVVYVDYSGGKPNSPSGDSRVNWASPGNLQSEENRGQGKPTSKEFLINLDQSFQNITDLNSVVRLIVLKAMMSSGIANLVNFDVQGLAGTLMDTSTQLAMQVAGKGLETLKRVAQDPGQVAVKGLNTLTTAAQSPIQIAGTAEQTLKNTAKNTTGVLKNTAQDVTGEVKNVAKSLKNKIKISF